MGVREARIFAERLGFTPTQIAELVTAVEEIERKLLRHRSPSAQLIVRVQPSGTTLEWAASSMRISNEDSRAMYIGPLPSTAGRATLPPQGRDPAIEGAGWRWLSKGPELILLGRPHPRETLSGDMAMVNRRGDKMRLAVADGLGHGPLAREASRRAVESLRATVALSLEEAVLAAHEQIATTRGATLGLAEVDLTTRIIRATTVGNVRVAMFFGTGRVWSPCGTDAVLGHGRGGSHGRLDIRVEQHPWQPDTILALFSDGLLNQLRLPWQRGELDELAAQLFHTFSIATDDATLLLMT